MKKTYLPQLLDFIKMSEGLKTLTRHSWLSSGRRESVAEHTWRMAMMVLVLVPELQLTYNLDKLLTMILIHDVPEIEAGDTPAFKKHTNKHALEKKALVALTVNLPVVTRQKFMELWLEFEANQTIEAQIAHALDKLEVLIQHNQAATKTWSKKERTPQYSIYYGDEFCEFNQTLKLLKQLVRVDTAQKLGMKISTKIIDLHNPSSSPPYLKGRDSLS